MFTSINIVEFGFSDWIIYINGWEWKSSFTFEFIKSVDSCCSFFRDTNEIFWNFCEELIVFW
jgi:hypothetical protein